MAQTLLLADDSPTIQRVIELTFADEDVRVVAVSDGMQAIEQIKAEPPDIVFADTNMPKRNGYEVATFIKADAALAHIPVVLLTGAFEPVDDSRAREIGCDAVLVKPFEPQKVIARVQELLGRRRSPALVSDRDLVDACGAPSVDEDGANEGVPTTESFRIDTELAANRKSSGGPSFPVGKVVSDADSDIESLNATVSALEGALDALTPESDSEGGVVDEWDSAAGDGSVSKRTATLVSAVDGSDSAAVPTLGDAFVSLLAVEQETIDEPPTINRRQSWTVPGISEELIDRVSQRVVERLSDTITGDVVADIVSRVAERLVRQEIDRIK